MEARISTGTIGLRLWPESLLARGAIALVALHLLDDAFVRPERGASARDHVVSGLVPALALLAVAWIYPRLRAESRAVAALAVGTVGIAAGAAEAGYHLTTGGFGGDDYTGLLALGAGVILVVVGAVVLWRSRRLDERRGQRYLRRSLIAIAAAVLLYELAVPVLFAFAYTHFGRATEPTGRLGLHHEDVRFTTSDGLRLAGSYVPSKNRAAVIVLPARGRKQALPHVRMLARHGYGVLVFDPRGTGASEGDPHRWSGGKDVEAALAYLRRRPDDPDRIAGLGLSLGGELMLETAGRNDALKAVVSEGAGIRSIREQLDKPRAGKWLSAPFWLSWTAATALFTGDAPPPDLEQAVARIAPRPVFLIYAGHPVGGEELNARFYAAAHAPKQIWRIADAQHTGGLERHPREYEHRVIAFFDHAVLAKEDS
jgi:uncharacterized protein